jgi:hypothetical protein
VPAEAKASFGQDVEVPVQTSATSQAPFAARQTVPCAAGAKPHTLLVQVATPSQVPAAPVWGQSAGVWQQPGTAVYWHTLFTHVPPVWQVPGVVHMKSSQQLPVTH